MYIFVASDTSHHLEAQCRIIFHLQQRGKQHPWRTPADGSRFSSQSAAASEEHLVNKLPIGSKLNTATMT